MHVDSLEPEDQRQEIVEQEPICGRGARPKRLTWKLLERMPTAPAPPPTHNAHQKQAARPIEDPELTPIPAEIDWFRTIPNPFSILRDYLGIPSHNPDTGFTLEKVTDIQPTTLPSVIQDDDTSVPAQDIPCEHRFPNSSLSAHAMDVDGVCYEIHC